jgi:BirA family biotin operon repressor/biotin-[acetyl-CoA-carboxylase] ligase
MALVIGIGLNLSGAQALRLELEREVADLTGLPGGAPPREALLIEMVSALHGVLRDFEAGEDSRLLEAWARYDLLRGRAVEIALEEGTLHGIARGVSPVGALILEAGGALREVYAGEARVLRR